MNSPSPFFISSACLLIGSSVVYHHSQKSISTELHPFFPGMITFCIALAVSLVLLPSFMGQREAAASMRQIGRANILSGLSLVGIVTGHVLSLI